MTSNANLCFIGSMLGRNAGYVTTQGQIVADLFEADGFNVTCVSSRLNRPARLAEIIKTILKDGRRFDAVVVETYSGKSFLIADVVSLLCSLFRIPLVLVLHGGGLPVFAEQHPRWVARVLKRADRLVAPSEFIAHKFRDRGFRISVIPNVVDLSKCVFRERTALEPRLIWMRSFHPFYNPGMAIRVFADLRSDYPQATLTMAGVDKGLKAEVEQLAREMRVDDSVRFPGFLGDDLKAIELCGADIFINTNRIDNMPVSVMEARAFGLPVVATGVGGLPYMIESGEDGMLVPDGDIGAMTSSIKKLLADPELAQKISKNGRMASERSDWKNVRKEWEKLFSGLMREGRRRMPELETTDSKC